MQLFMMSSSFKTQLLEIIIWSWKTAVLHLNNSVQPLLARVGSGKVIVVRYCIANYNFEAVSSFLTTFLKKKL